MISRNITATGDSLKAYDVKVKFDKDLSYGQNGEAQLQELLEGIAGGEVTLEVKSNRPGLCKRTGNAAIETSYRGRPSGLMTTSADWWAIRVEGRIVMIQTSLLRHLVNEADEHGFRKVFGGDEYQSELVLIPLADLLTL